MGFATTIGLWVALGVWGDQEGKSATLTEDPSLFVSRGEKTVAQLAKIIAKMAQEQQQQVQ